jgi:Ammonium Transporter Family
LLLLQSWSNLAINLAVSIFHKFVLSKDFKCCSEINRSHFNQNSMLYCGLFAFIFFFQTIRNF